jgi:Protein of unknown function (DUF2846)
MTIRALAVTGILALTLLSACATSGPKFSDMTAEMSATSKPGVGRIYFYRTSVLGAAVQPEVRLNGQAVGHAIPQGFFFVDCPPGNYEVSTSTEVERKLTFTMEADQTRYVRLNISMGFLVGHVYGELVDEAKGRSEITATRYTGFPIPKP